MTTTVSPLAPTHVPDMPRIAGVRLATAAAGIRYKDRTDVLLALFDKGTTVAGVFTKSKCPSAAVDWCRSKLKGGEARALVVNSGNANAFTGKSGKQSTTLTAAIAAKATETTPGKIFLASTGVIGEPLDATKFDGVLDELAQTAAPDGWHNAARAIMTTDTFAKVATATVKLGNTKVRNQRYGQGRRHDCAGHGDHAGVHLYRCSDFSGSSPVAAQNRRGGYVQRRHHRRRHIDVGYAACIRDGSCRGQRRAEDHPRCRSTVESFHESIPRGVGRSRRTGRDVAPSGEGVSITLKR